MSPRDSDSKRRHSRFDRKASPRRYTRDGRQDRNRNRNRVRSSANLVNGEQKNHRHLPLEPPFNQQPAPLHKHKHSHDNKPIDPTQLPLSLSFQHDERGSTGQVSRSSGQRKAAERGWWKDSRNQHNERAETSHCGEQRDMKSQAEPVDNTFQRRDDFSERKDDPPATTRKRAAFREKRIPMKSGDANPAEVKSSQIDQPPERNERRVERSSNLHHLDRPEKQFADNRAPNKADTRKDGFPLRGRYGGSGGNSNYGGRDKFNERRGYHPSTSRTEKWKHDLYQEVNKDPIPKNEDDQIEKLEALLAS